MMFMVARPDGSDGPQRLLAGRARDGGLRRKARVEPSGTADEGVRVLANEARDALRARGIPNVMIDRLAARFIAEGHAERVGDSVDDFVEWADTRARGSL